MKPVTRLETLVQTIIEGSDLPFSAVDRIEMFLSDIISGQVSSIAPVTRIEKYLAKISGQDIDIPTPITRIECFLAAIAGMNVNLPTTVTRLEMLLNVWADSAASHTLSGPIVSFLGKSSTEILGLSVALDPIQDLHGYDHPWPAGGYGVDIIPIGTDTDKGYVSDAYLKDDGTIGSVSGINISEYFPVKSSTAYRITKDGGQSMISASICFYDANKNYLTGEKYNNRATFTIASPSTAAYSRVSLAAVVGSKISLWEDSNICPITGWTGVNVYVSPTQDEADATVYNVAFGEAGTVYAGSVDVVTGVLTVDRKLVTLTGADNWAVAGTSRFYCPLSSQEYSQSTSEDAQISSIYLFGATQSGGSADVTQDKHFYLQRTYTLEYCRVWVYDTDYTLETFKAMLNNTPLQVTYPIVPTTYQLDPQTVQTLVGQNVVWSDAGDVSVTVKNIVPQ